jgi:hypothetical protein
MQPDDSLIFSAVVTDPDGIDDLIGGILVNPSGNTYGAFITSAQEGTYSLTIRWADINAVDPIYAEPGGSPRIFRAQFFDQGGNSISADLSITLACDDDAYAACAGECHFLEWDVQNCGVCHLECADFRPAVDQNVSLIEDLCVSGQCGWVLETTQREPCALFCDRFSLECTPYNIGFGWWVGGDTCTDDSGGCGLYVYVSGSCSLSPVSVGAASCASLLAERFSWPNSNCIYEFTRQQCLCQSR